MVSWDTVSIACSHSVKQHFPLQKELSLYEGLQENQELLSSCNRSPHIPESGGGVAITELPSLPCCCPLFILYVVLDWLLSLYLSPVQSLYQNKVSEGWRT